MPEAPRLLVPVDRSEPSFEAVKLAASLTEPTHVWCVQVLAAEPALLASDPAGLEDRRAAALHELRQDLAEHHVGGVVQVRVGRPAEQIASMARDFDMAGIVMPSHGRRGLSRLLLGSVAERVLRLAPCPVLVFKTAAAGERLMQARPKMLLSVDLQEAPERVIAAALPWVERLDAEVHLAYAVPQLVPGDAEDAEAQLRHKGELEGLLERLPEAHRGGTAVLGGSPRDAVVSVADRYDLVAVGHHGRTGVERLLLGSTTEGVARLVDAVLVLPVYTGV